MVCTPFLVLYIFAAVTCLFTLLNTVEIGFDDNGKSSNLDLKERFSWIDTKQRRLIYADLDL